MRQNPSLNIYTDGSSIASLYVLNWVLIYQEYQAYPNKIFGIKQCPKNILILHLMTLKKKP